MIGRILSVFLVILALWVFLREFTVDPVFVFSVFSFWAVSGFIVDVALGRRDFFDPAFLFLVWVFLIGKYQLVGVFYSYAGSMLLALLGYGLIYWHRLRRVVS